MCNLRTAVSRLTTRATLGKLYLLCTYLLPSRATLVKLLPLDRLLVKFKRLLRAGARTRRTSPSTSGNAFVFGLDRGASRAATDH